MIYLKTPLTNDDIAKLKVYDKVLLSGKIYAGRDAVLPKAVNALSERSPEECGIFFEGNVVFHTAVSPAGVGPTSSNKYEIESNIPALSEMGVKIHLGKGSLKSETIEALKKNNSIYAVIPPVTALLESKTVSKRVVAFPEEGMEALYELEIVDYPIIVAAANGVSIYD